MMPEELQSLEESKGIYREMLKGLNLEIAATKKKLEDLMNRWGDINKEYERLDRRIALETKITIIKHKPSKTPEMTADQASAWWPARCPTGANPRWTPSSRADSGRGRGRCPAPKNARDGLAPNRQPNPGSW